MLTTFTRPYLLKCMSLYILDTLKRFSWYGRYLYIHISEIEWILDIWCAYENHVFFMTFDIFDISIFSRFSMIFQYFWWFLTFFKIFQDFRHFDIFQDFRDFHSFSCFLDFLRFSVFSIFFEIFEISDFFIFLRSEKYLWSKLQGQIISSTPSCLKLKSSNVWYFEIFGLPHVTDTIFRNLHYNLVNSS